MPFKQIFETIDAGLLVLDQDFCVVEWNRWMEHQSKIPRDEAVGKILFEIYPNLKVNWFTRSCKTVLHFGNYAFFSRKLHGYCFPFLLEKGPHSGFEYMQQDCQVSPIRMDNGDIMGLFIMVNDVTDVAISEKRILSMANRDGLTGLFIRRYFDEQLDDEFSRYIRYDRMFSLILLDIDFFKVVNDVHGHLFGDFVLKRLAAILQENSREVDTVARFGGEEFAVIMPETNVAQAEAKAETLRQTIEESVFCKDNVVNYQTASFGVSSCLPGDTESKEIIARADKALYAAKDSGRNAVRVFRDSE